jgi:hypothetical protein
MKNALFILSLAVLAIALTGCPPAAVAPTPTPAASSQASQLPDCVDIVDAGTHYAVTMDYGSGATSYQMGFQLGRQIKIALASQPFQALLDGYINDAVILLASGTPYPANVLYTTAIARLADILPQVPREYRDEIDGLADSVCDAATNVRNDGKVSRDELYMVELILDVSKLNSCSAVSVFGDLSATNKTITGRVLDWYGGSSNQLARIQAVTTIKRGSKSIVLVGYLGYLAGLTVMNDDKVFAAILESGSPGTTVTANKRSYSMDLRYAMENCSSLADVAAYLSNSARSYVAGHLVFLSDPDQSRVLENDLANARALRSDESPLNASISWGFLDAVGSVNSFILDGNYDNHSGSTSNSARWNSLKIRLAAKGSAVTSAEVGETIASFSGTAPGNQSDGDLYNVSTQEMVIVEPDSMAMKIFFRPKTGILPAIPVFETVNASF